MTDIIHMWKDGYREAPAVAKFQYLYMVIGLPVIIVGSLIHLARFL